MDFKKNVNMLNLNKVDLISLFVLLIFSIIISINLINFNMGLGIYCSDVFVYLINSLSFAGFNIKSTSTMYLSPIICFLTSILIRLGLHNELSIYIVTSCFGILGNIGLYIFLKNKFSSILSLTGAILFGSFTLNLLWWGNGSLDIPAVALSIWVIIFSIVAIDKNPKFYLIAFPLFVVAIFTRYTTAFILPLILLYYFTKHDFFVYLDNFISDRYSFKRDFKTFFKSDNFKYLSIGILLAIILVVLIISVILSFGSPLSFLTQTSTFVSGSKGELIDNAYTTDTLFYLHEFLNFLFANKIVFDNLIPVISNTNYLAYLILGIIIIGMSIGIYNFVYRLKFNLNGNNNNFYFKTRYFSKFLLLSFIFCILIGIVSFKINSIITITFLLISLVILFAILVNYFNREDYSLTALALAWFLIYFLFFTFLNIKVNRYIIPSLPGFVYFVVYSIDFILKLLSGDTSENIKINLLTSGSKVGGKVGKNILNKFNSRYLIKNIIPIILIVLCVTYAFSFTSTVEVDETIKAPEILSEFLINYDSNYSEHQVAVYNQRVFNWYLKNYTIPMVEDSVDVLESSNITYFISKHNVHLFNYTEIYNVNNLYLYKHI